jgi:hypothetical protein
MLENSSAQVTSMYRRRQRPRLPTEAQARRVEELRRAFQRLLGRRPTLIEKAAMLRSAGLVARAEALALDPNADVNEVVKLNNLAARTLRALGIRAAEPPAKARGNGLELARQCWAEAEKKAETEARAASSAAQSTEGPPDGRAA